MLEAIATAATAVGDDVATATCRCPGATRLAMLALLAALVALAIAGVAGVPATERLGFGASLEMGVIPPGHCGVVGEKFGKPWENLQNHHGFCLDSFHGFCDVFFWWAKKKKNSYFPWNTGWLKGSPYNGLLYNHHITD